MGKTLILVGGGHAHMETLAHLEKFVQKGFQVTVVGPSTHHYYSGMGPGMLGKTYTPKEICFATKDVVEKKGGTFIKDKGTRIDPSIQCYRIWERVGLQTDSINPLAKRSYRHLYRAALLLRLWLQHLHWR